MDADKYNELLTQYVKECDAGQQKSLLPLLSMFRIRGKPMNMRLHFQFAPMFSLLQPRRQVWRCARQLGKSFSIASKGLLQSSLIPDFHILYVQPRFDQIKRFNQTILRPLVNSSIIKNDLISAEEARAFLLKTFKNNSNIYLEYALLSAERIRGITGVSSVMCDEVQDIDYDFLPIIRETMSATIKYGFQQYSGTAKTSDGTLDLLFNESSMGHWCIPCSCGYPNLAHPEEDLFKMIGLKTCVCRKCDKPLDTREGYYVHGYPERRASFPGYHLSQITHPLHCAIPAKWEDLLEKMHSYGKVKFFNEVLGISCDESVKLLTKEDLIRASNNISPDKDAAIERITNYDVRVMGVDWSGGGLLGHSHTTACIMGGRPGTDTLDTLYGIRLPLGMQAHEEAGVLIELFKAFNCQYFAHDYTGAGYNREALMVQMGMPSEKFIPFTYNTSPRKDVISLHSPTDGARSSYILDKPRSLAIMTTMVKCGKITLPALRDVSPVFTDLLNLIEDPRERLRGSVLYLIGKAANKPDDMAHSVNFAASAIWYLRGGYPRIPTTDRFKIDKATLNSIDPLTADRV